MRPAIKQTRSDDTFEIDARPGLPHVPGSGILGFPPPNEPNAENSSPESPLIIADID